MSSTQDEIQIRKPMPNDGYEIHHLIANSPPLDLNSIYSYYLLSDHFRDSCVVAEHQGNIVGFISAYRIPRQQDVLFVWQVVVSESQRGQRIAWRMLESLVERFDRREVRQVQATVNPSNLASRGLFEHLAAEQGTILEEDSFLDISAFGPDAGHESEILLRIPLNTQNS